MVESHWRVALHGAGRLPRQLSLLVPFSKMGAGELVCSGTLHLAVGCCDGWGVCVTSPSCGFPACSQQLPGGSLCPHAVTGFSAVRTEVMCALGAQSRSPFEKAEHLNECSAAPCLAWVRCGTCREPKVVQQVVPALLKAKKTATIDASDPTSFPAEHRNSR